MIITLKGANFSSCNIGALNLYRVTLSKSSGVSGSLSVTSFEKNQVLSSATVIANLAVVSGYENLTVTVTMGGTSVNAWYSNGVVTIPSNTTISGDIKISASATAVSGGDVVDPEPEQPGTGGGSGETPSVPTTTTWYIEGLDQSNISVGTTANVSSSAGFAHHADNTHLFINKPINAIRLCMSKTGTMSYGKYNKDQNTFTNLGTLNITGDDRSIIILKLNETVTLSSGENFWIFDKKDTGNMYYLAHKTNSNMNKFYYNISSDNLTGTINTARSISFDLGYVVE